MTTRTSRARTRDAEMNARLRQVCAGRTTEEIGRTTGVSSETARRYLHGAAPTAVFVSLLCSWLRKSPTWLLLGLGEPDLDPSLAAQVADARAPRVKKTRRALITTRRGTLEQLKESVDDIARVAASAARPARERPAQASRRARSDEPPEIPGEVEPRPWNPRGEGGAQGAEEPGEGADVPPGAMLGGRTPADADRAAAATPPSEIRFMMGPAARLLARPGFIPEIMVLVRVVTDESGNRRVEMRPMPEDESIPEGWERYRRVSARSYTWTPQVRHETRIV